MSGYLQTKGTRVVDPSGNDVVLRGTNLGGWLVWEDWMCGITDNSGTHDRFPQTTLTKRFGEDKTYELLNVWYDNWLVSSDFDNIANMGFNVVRLPFSYKNFIRSDGSYINDANGNVDFSRLEWAIAEAKKRNIYVIPTYHIWDGQEEKYSAISEDTWEGQQQRNKAGELWTKIAAHFVGENAIAGYDAINEPTGSANNNLQRDLYKAIRAGDSKRIIIMESISAAPDSDWTNVMYSMHEYLMMGESDQGYNQQMFEQGVREDTNTYSGVGVPTYIGEFMASDGTLSWMLDQMNQMGVWWSGWAYKTVNMDRWGLYNYGGNMRVDVSADSFDSIKSTWSNMGGISKSRVVDIYTAAAGGKGSWKRDTPVEKRDAVASPRVEQPRLRRSSPAHGGRSRRMAHAGKAF
jgi:aryl-phospho-beta-D-glucosidase BglC (GH1 family)